MSATCSGFVPHAVKATRCKRCFRELSDHRDPDGPSQKTTGIKPKPKLKFKQKEAVNGASKEPEKAKAVGGPRKEEECEKKHQSEDASSDSKGSVQFRRRRADGTDDAAAANAIESKRGSVARRSRELNPPESEVATRRRRSGNDQDGNSEGSGKRVQIIATTEVERPISPGQRLPPETSNEINSADVEFILKVRNLCTFYFIVHNMH